MKVIMSQSACEFVTPLTFQALSRNEVYTDTFDEKNPKVIAHIDLADWADLVMVAPATANIIGKLANGIADDMITTTLLATVAPVWIAPAMNVHMYDHPAVKRNIDQLAKDGYSFCEPSEGYLACGYVGKGRLEEPENIVSLVENYFNNINQQPRPLKGKNILITAGPTREKLDPIRFFSNRSTGKMGYALAKSAAQLGANVTLISGPTAIAPPPNVETIFIESAEEMYEEVMKRFSSSQVVVKSAAVADYRPKIISSEKVKKKDGDWHIEMDRTKDILSTLGSQKKDQMLIGFAAETENVKENALKKLKTKNLDMIIANDVKESGAGFGTDTNIVTIFHRSGKEKKVPLMTKDDLALEIWEEVISQFKSNSGVTL